MNARNFLVIALLFCVATAASFPEKTMYQKAYNNANFYMKEIQKQMSKATPSIEVISGESQNALTATSEAMKNASKAADQTVEMPIGLPEKSAQDLTEMKTLLGDLKQKISTMSVPEGNALDEGQESSLIGAEEKMKLFSQELQSNGSPTIATIPSEVSTSLANLAIDAKHFSSTKRPKRTAPAKTSTTASQATRIMLADSFGAGDNKGEQNNNNNNGQINQALQRLNKNIKKTKKQHQRKGDDIQISLLQQNNDFKNLAKRMKSLETSLQQIPTLKQSQEQQKKRADARKAINDDMKAYTAPDAKPASASASDISAKKVQLMSELVSHLDELGRFFGEDEIIDEDDSLSIKEDPKIALVESNLQAAVQRIKSDLRAKPNRFESHRRLEDISHYLSNPVPITRTAPGATDDVNDNLSYLRNLRNYVVSLRENSK